MRDGVVARMRPTTCTLCPLQAQELTDAGHVPDKVILLEGPHALLLNRVKYRRIDYTTGRDMVGIGLGHHTNGTVS